MAGRRIKRPASSWFALVVVGVDVVLMANFFVPVLASAVLRKALEEGYAEMPEVMAPLTAGMVSWGFLMVAMIALCIGWRSRWTYFLGGGGLLLATYGNVEELFWSWRTSEAQGFVDQGIDFLFFLAVSGLLGYLGVKFLTGTPSRRYYRMAPW